MFKTRLKHAAKAYKREMEAAVSPGLPCTYLRFMSLRNMKLVAFLSTGIKFTVRVLVVELGRLFEQVLERHKV